jgi:hypothetical protein
MRASMYALNHACVFAGSIEHGPPDKGVQLLPGTPCCNALVSVRTLAVSCPAVAAVMPLLLPLTPWWAADWCTQGK